MTKLFECFWGAGYRGDDDKSILAYHNQEFFTEDRGYEPKEIENIKNLSEEIYKFTKDTSFKKCKNMGEIVQASFSYVRRNYENLNMTNLVNARP